MMQRTRKGWLIALGIAFMAFSFTPAGDSVAQVKKTRLLCMGGPLGGTSYMMTAGLAKIAQDAFPELILGTVPGSGLTVHVLTGKGEIDIGNGSSVYVTSARAGKPPFEEAFPDIRVILGGMGNWYLHWAVFKDSPYQDIEQILQAKKPIRVGVATPGTSDEWCFRMILKAYGVTYDDIKKWGGSILHSNYNDLKSAMQDGHIDTFFLNIDYPAAALMEVTLHKPVRLLDMPKKVLETFPKEYGLAPAKIPQATYKGMDRDATTLLTQSIMIANKNVPDDAVYKYAKALCENVDKVKAIHKGLANFNPKDIWKDLGGPFHPGAEKYAREKGYIN